MGPEQRAMRATNLQPAPCAMGVSLSSEDQRRSGEAAALALRRLPDPGGGEMNAQQRQFLETVAPWAQAGQREYGVPASVTIAQAILESSNNLGWGQSQLARDYNNFFGVKATDHAAPNTYVELPTPEFVNGAREIEEARFARYDSPAESFEAHARLLATAGRYKPAMAVRNDPVPFAGQLQVCGYSTSPTYASQLCRLIRIYNLTQYDAPPDGPAQEARAA